MLVAVSEFGKDRARVKKIADWLATPEALAVDMVQATWAVRCGAVVLLSGYFESFLRDCMCAFIRDVNALGRPIEKLPSKLRYTHYENGSRVLGRLLREERKQKVPPVQCENLTLRLASVKGGASYTLAWEAFAETKANPSAEVVGELLKCVGVKDPWGRLRTRTPAGLGNLELFLDTFIPMRNECAHSGNTTSPPTGSELAQYCQNFEGVGAAFVGVLTQQIVEFTAL